MANVSRVNGFRPIKDQFGRPYNGATTMYYVTSGNATAIGIGDLVVLEGTTDAAGVRCVKQAAANGVCVGPVVGVKVSGGTGAPSLDAPQYVPASTGKYVYVADDPNIHMVAQEDAVGGATALTDIGQNINFIVAAASTVTGLSGMQVDSSTKDTLNTLPLRLVGFLTSPENEVATANAKVIVAFNTHQYRSGTGSTGV